MGVKQIAAITDLVERWWWLPALRRARAVLLVLTLVFGVVLAELARLGIIADQSPVVPGIHLVAISWAVTVLLVFEIVEMVLSLGRSVAESVGRHLQVYALLLLRDAFAKLAMLPEPIAITSEQYHALGVMGADAAGAIALFMSATLFTRLQRHTPIATDQSATERFVAIKKSIALGLLVLLTWLAGRDLVSLLWGEKEHALFDDFFTVLIFVDVLIAIVSLGFTERPPIVFRNFGFAFAAILLRLAVAAPDFLRPGLGLSGAAVAVLVTLAYNFALDEPTPDGFVEPQPDAAR